jgi:hypothetical protein
MFILLLLLCDAPTPHIGNPMAQAMMFLLLTLLGSLITLNCDVPLAFTFT